MEDMPEHPLLAKRMAAAVAVLALCSGVGLALMGFDLVTLGLIISALGAIGVVSIYWSDFRRLRLRLAIPHGTAPLSRELLVVILALVVGLGAPAYVFVMKMWPAAAVERHLTTEQKIRMRADLKLRPDERSQFEINTVPSCDECEKYAQQLRDFFNTLPGFRTYGGPLIFAESHYPSGIRFLTNGNEPKSSPAIRVLKALQDAGLNPQKTAEPAVPKGKFIILIGRQRDH